MISAYLLVNLKHIFTNLLHGSGKRIVFLSASRYCAINIIQEGPYDFI